MGSPYIAPRCSPKYPEFEPSFGRFEQMFIVIFWDDKLFYRSFFSQAASQLQYSAYGTLGYSWGPRGHDLY